MRDEAKGLLDSLPESPKDPSMKSWLEQVAAFCKKHEGLRCVQKATPVSGALAQLAGVNSGSGGALSWARESLAVLTA